MINDQNTAKHGKRFFLHKVNKKLQKKTFGPDFPFKSSHRKLSLKIFCMKNFVNAKKNILAVASSVNFVNFILITL